MSISPLARLQILAAVTLFSTGGAAIKSCSLTGWQVAGFRSGLAAIVMLLVLPQARRNWSWRMVLVSIAYAATVISYVTANKMTTALNTIFLQSTAPIYVLLVSPWLLKESIRRRDLVYLIAVAAGMALVFTGAETPMATAPNPEAGNVIAALGGIAFGLTIAGLRWLGKTERIHGGSALGAVALGNVLACVICLPVALPVSGGSSVDWLIIAYLGIVQIALAYLLLILGLRHVRAFEGSVLMLLEPILNPVWAWAVHGETAGVRTLSGAALILLATALKTWIEMRSAARGERPT